MIENREQGSEGTGQGMNDIIEKRGFLTGEAYGIEHHQK